MINDARRNNRDAIDKDRRNDMDARSDKDAGRRL